MLGLAGALAISAALGGEGRAHADFRTEWERFKATCNFQVKKAAGCGALLATDHPLHLAFGSIAPQNGFGIGGALVGHVTPGENWRISWNSDAVGATTGAWRAGTYFKFVRTTVELPKPVKHARNGAIEGLSDYEHPIITVYGQMISLPSVFFFGLGPDSAHASKTAFGFSEGIAGATATLPLARKSAGQVVHLTALAEVNERVPSIRTGSKSGVDPTQLRFTAADAPGLDSQPTFTQFGEGIRARPSAFADHVGLDYLAKFDQFVATDSANAFRRWTVDLEHEIRLYATSFPTAHQTNGPDECAQDPKAHECPVSHDRSGTISIRARFSRSTASRGAAVPFYFQPTLGGSDIDGERSLAAFDDYRFRGTGVSLIQESFEHSLGKWPVGVFIEADQGNVALPTQRLWSVAVRKSVAAGLDFRAGGFPALTIAYAKGSEGHHTIVVLSTGLLGGSARPSLQ